MQSIMAPLDPPIGLRAAAIGVMFILVRQWWMLREVRHPKNTHATHRCL
jgi:hypothetical protein